MRFMLLAVAVGLILAFVAGRRSRSLGVQSLRMWFLLSLGLMLQLAAAGQPGPTWPLVLTLVGYACLVAFAVVNLSATGMWMVVVGLVLNAVVVGANHGMPIGRKATASIGHQPAVSVVEHHVQRSSDKLTFLGAIVPVRPVGEVVSFGDLILAVGLVDVLVRLSRPVKVKAKRRHAEEPAVLPLVDSVVHT
jgi:hypothetical protein